MLIRLAWAALSRHLSRTLLATLGVAVSAAMLLDMVMLSSGMRASLQDLLLSRGFQLRLAPKGTLPFDTEATIADASGVTTTLRTVAGVETISPVLGAQLHARIGDRTISTVALGVISSVQGDYEITHGRAPASVTEMVGNDDFVRASKVRIGDTISVAAGL